MVWYHSCKSNVSHKLAAYITHLEQAQTICKDEPKVEEWLSYNMRQTK